MKNITIIITLATLFVGATAFGQGGNTGHLSTAGEFLGWNGTGTNQPLQIRNDFNQPISLHTNGVERMRLWQSNVVTLNAGTSNAATINQGGFLGIGQPLNFFSGAFAVGPYSLLHLNGAGSLGAGNSASRISLGLNGENNLAWSMLHLWGKTLG